MQLAAAPGPETSDSGDAQPAPAEDNDSVQVTDIFIWVQVPANSPAGHAIYIEVVDEVTGLPFNAERTELRSVDATHYGVAMRVPVGTVLKYRYLRIDAGGGVTPETTLPGEPVRYRVFLVDGPGEVHDLVARWADTASDDLSGRITGIALDVDTLEPIPNLLVFAAGQQTLTLSDGSFRFHNIPPGVHLISAISMDGSYQTYKQNAKVAAEATTPATLQLQAAELVRVSFVVDVPESMLPATPLRLAGNLAQLGNSFAELGGGISGFAGTMPVLEQTDDHEYSITLMLPAQVEILYKYTLGDGFWNAEHAADLDFLVRRLYIPRSQGNLRVEDRILTFQAGSGAPAWFDANLTAFMPPGDTLSIQFKLSEWMSPIPMWPVAESRWAFQIISPTQIGGDLVYRYCRSNLCGEDYTISTELDPATRVTAIGGEETSVQVDHIANWQEMSAPAFAVTVLDNPVVSRGQDFIAGIMFSPGYSPLWAERTDNALTEISRLNANTLVLRPTWGASNDGLPAFQPEIGRDADWSYLVLQIRAAHDKGLRVAIAPQLRFNPVGPKWWSQTPRDGEWWGNWWEQCRAFVLHFADLAEQEQAEFLMLDGSQVAEALPGAFPDSPADANARWLELIEDVRTRYTGQLAWNLPFDAVDQVPAFLSSLDMLSVEWGASLGTWEGTTLAEMQSRSQVLLEDEVRPLKERFELPVVLLISYPSAEGGLTGCVAGNDGCVPLHLLEPGQPPPDFVTLDLVEQMEVYNALLAAVNETPWLDGVISEGFFPPSGLLDKSTSIHGKPAAEVLRYWFGRLLGQ
ncbi:MAG: hypothetical protein EPO32_04430 [Anaerolineae bacterium]|nr:MAG: hypothetical protein EPO32_04430 [Anaerolineae bacterium]